MATLTFKDDKPKSSTGKEGNIDHEEAILRKRLPKTFPKRKNDIYVSRKTNFKAQLCRCEKLLDAGSPEIFIHGLGAAINRAINLSLQLKAGAKGSLEVATNTSTVELVDDLEPRADDQEAETLTRNNSAVHIRVFRVGMEENSPTKDQQI